MTNCAHKLVQVFNVPLYVEIQRIALRPFFALIAMMMSLSQRVPMKRKVEEKSECKLQTGESSNAQEICDIINKVSEKPKFKKIHVNIEFIDDE